MVELKLRSGKADFVRRRMPDGKVEKICLCEYNADFSSACIAQVHNSLLEEVIQNNGCYIKKNVGEYRKQRLLDNRCEYCYAKRKNWGKITPKEIGDITKKNLKIKNQK